MSKELINEINEVLEFDITKIDKSKQLYELGIDSMKLVQTIGVIEQYHNITLEVEEFYDITVNDFLKIVENKQN